MRLLVLIPILLSLSAEASAFRCGFERLMRSPEEKEFDRRAEAAARDMEHLRRDGWVSLERDDRLAIPYEKLQGMAVTVLEAHGPQEGKPGTIRRVEGYIERLAKHFIMTTVDPRRPRYDGIVVVDGTGKRTLLNPGFSTDRIYIHPERRIELPEGVDNLDDVLEQPGWERVSPKNRELIGHIGEKLVGKEIIGYQTVGTSKHEVRGVIRAVHPFTKWDYTMSGMKFSPVTGEPPYIAIEVITPEGTNYEHPLSAPGTYYIRDLNPKND